MDTKTRNFCDLITPIYSMDVYVEWRDTLREDGSNFSRWYTQNHAELSVVYMEMHAVMRDKGMGMRSFIDFCTDAYTVMAYHTEYDAAVSRELTELTKSFPYTKF